jgi:murein DD-endopeptidase MepM/ murein hydrolase activator NlpD
MNPKVLLWLAANRRRIGLVLAPLVAAPLGLLAVLAGAFTTTPLVPDRLIPLYVLAAERLPVEGLEWEMFVAVDAIRFRQDFSKVTPASIRETAWLFVACRTDDHVEDLEHHLRAEGTSVAHPLKVAVPSTVTWTLFVESGGPSVRLLNSQDEEVFGATVDPGLYYLRVVALFPDTRFRLVLTVSPLEPTCTGRTLDEVMDQLGFDAAEREMAKEMVRAFVEASLKEFRPRELHYVWPVAAYRISSGYGPRIHPVRKLYGFHTGIDIPAPEGTPVRAVAAGEVIFADVALDYGNLVRIDHGGFQTLYAHLADMWVQAGERVEAGQVIGTVGSTGVSLGPHLHFEWRVDGGPVSPLPYWR